MEINIELDRAQLRRLDLEFRDMPKAVTTILVRGINRTVGTGKTRVTRRLAKMVGLTQKLIRPHLRTRKASAGNISGAVVITNKRFSLMLFNAKQTPVGVVYKTTNGRGMIPGAFIATMPSGKTDVFKRKGKPRLPIQKQKGPALVEVLTTAQGVVEEEQRGLVDVLRKNVDSQIQFMLARRSNALLRAA